MRKAKKLTSILALALTLSMILSACQVPEGVEIPSGVSVPSDLSDLTSEELEQLESYLDEVEGSVDADNSEEAVTEDQQTEGAEEAAADAVDAEGAEDVTDGKAEVTTGVDKDTAEKSTVKLPSGRDWVHKILNVEEYRKAYPDLQAAYGDNWDGYVDHYLTHGLYEGRDEGKLFDPWVYAESYPDVKAAYGDDVNAIIAHYVNHGVNEGKTAGTSAGYVDMADKVSREYMMSHDVVVREPGTRLEALIGHAETALKYARNIEGANQPRLFVDGYNKYTYEPTKWNKGLQSDEPVASNVYSILNFLKMLDGLTLMTGDPKYYEAAKEQIAVRFNTPGLVDDNGVFYAGGHAFIDVMTGEKFGLEYHETKDYQLPWEFFWKIDPEGTKRMITGLWNEHILDWSNLAMNRHGVFNTPMTDVWDSEFTDTDPWMEAANAAAFMSTGNDLMEMAFFLTEATGDPKYAVWGERMLDKYIAVGNPETGLVGEQYGIMTEDSTYGKDRFLASVIGADFVTRTGFDFKTATIEDYKIFGANSLITRTSLKCNTAYGPMFWAELYKQNGNEKIYNFVKSNMLSWEEYIYDQKLHRYNTPILNDGTDLNEGKDGKQLIATKTGYYMTEGKPFPEYESVWGGVFPALIATVDMLKPDETEAYDRLWTAARSYARNVGLGDIGTRMGENIEMTPETGQCAAQYVQAVLMMYKYTGVQDYLDAACTMADRLVKSSYNPEVGAFDTVKNSPYIALDTETMYAVFMTEMAAQGYIDEIDFGICHSGSDIPYIGRGQVSTSEVWWNKSNVRVKEVKFDRESYSIVVDRPIDYNFSDLAGAKEPSAIKQMAAIGVINAEADGLYYPQKAVTRSDLVQMVKAFFGYEDAAVIADVFAEIDLAETYAHYEVTRAEMASVIARALAVAIPTKTWQSADATYRLTDAATIPAWAKEYADIVTNYRLMVDLEETTFEPTAVVTKDMAAGIFQEVGRYVAPPRVKAILPEVKPFNADTPDLFWESADTSIVEVDSKGRLYPVSEGTTRVRVTSDEEFTDLIVTVAMQNDWMVKEVFIDGELYEEFNPDVFAYEMNLDMGTHAVPVITGTSYNGAEVIVNPPAELPGRVEFHVDGSDVVYTIDFDNTYIDYIVDENFNHKIGTPIESITTDRFQWFINGITIAYKDRWKVIPKNWVRPDYEGYGCMVFPYEHKKNLDGQIYLTLSEEDTQLMGEAADDMLMVFEMDIAVKDMEGKKNGYDLWFMETFGSTYHAAAHFRIDHNGLQREVNNTSDHRPTKRELVDGEFINFRIVIDKKNRTFDYFFNGDLLQKDIEFFHPGDRVPDIHAMYIGTPMEEEACNAELFIDNLKIYQLTHAGYEEMMPQEELPPPTPKPEWLTNPINIDFDKFKVGTTIQQTGEEPYVGHIGEGNYYNYATVVEKTIIDAGATATDKCMEIKYRPDLTYDGSFRYILDEAVWQHLGDAADDNNLVVEMDVAIGGADKKPNGYNIAVAEPLAKGYHAIARLLLKENAIGRAVDSTNKMVDPTLRTATTDGVFNNIKIVINKKTKNFSYYVDGVMVEQNVNELHSNANQIGTIWFAVEQEAPGALDSKLYVDNLKVYVEAPGAEPTARPTHVPVPTPTPAPTATPHPYPVNENYDGYAEGTIFNSTSTEYYRAAVAEGAYTAYGKVVPKTVVDSTATEGDMVMEFRHGDRFDLNFRIDLYPERKFHLGDKAMGSRYLVAEADVAIKGDYVKEKGYQIWMNQRTASTYYSVARYKITDNKVQRFVDSRTLTAGVDYTKGGFAHLMMVVDKQTRKVTYFWNGMLVESEANPMFTETPDFGAIVFMIPKETDESFDSRFYVDNLKLYEADEMPVAPTMAPATPAPTLNPDMPTPTPAPTENPYFVELDFDDAELGKLMHTFIGDHWKASLGLSFHHDRGKVVAKNVVDADAAATDYCMEFTPVTSLDSNVYDMPFAIGFLGEKQYPLGNPVTMDKYVVVELDMAITGSDTKNVGYGIRMVGEGYFTLTNFRLYDNYLGRHLSSAVISTANDKNAYSKGEFVHFKWVLDRETKRYTYYLDGQMVESNVLAQFSGATETPIFRQLEFMIYKESLEAGKTSYDSKFYVDNIQVYVTDEALNEAPTPAPTAAPTVAPEATAAPTQAPTEAPTAAPTQAPAGETVVAQVSFDGFAENTGMRNISGDGWKGALDCGNYWRYGNVVSKAGAGFAGGAGDMCFEFKPMTNVNNVENTADTTIRDLNFHIDLLADRQIVIGPNATGDKYAIIEMDVAIKGDGEKTRGYDISVGTVNYYCLAKFNIKDNVIGRVNTASTGAYGGSANYTKGEMVHLKCVIDRQARTFDWYVNDQLIEAGAPALYTEENMMGIISHVRILDKSETLADGVTEDISNKLYIDNLVFKTTN